MNNSINIAKQEPFSTSEEKFAKLKELLKSKEILSKDHADLEDLITQEGRELMRLLFQEHIGLRGLGDVGPVVIGADKIERRHKRIRECNLTSIFGKIKIERIGYSAPKSISLFPKDAALNLTSDSYSFGIRKLVAIETSKNSFEESVNSVREATGVEIPKRQAERLALKAAQDFDHFYEMKAYKDKADQAKDTPLLILTTDGKGIVMRKKDLREATRKKAEETKHKLFKRTSKGEKKNCKRMATVAAVYDIDRFVRTPEDVIKELNRIKLIRKHRRPKPINKRVWASIEKDSKKVTDTIFQEAIKRDPEREKEWVCVVDGDPKQISRIKHSAKRYKVNITVVLDIIHVIEYLWPAARVFHEETDPKAEKWVNQRLLKILKGEASKVAAGIRRSATLYNIDKKKRDPVDKCSDYLLKKSPYLKYESYLKKGFPIGTGVIEGACRHLIKDRMDVTGARWSLSGAEAILKLRALRVSGDFDDYWVFHKNQEYFRNHKMKYGQPLFFDEPKFL